MEWLTLAPDYSDKTQKLRELLKHDFNWVWTDDHELAFNNLKKCLSKDTVLGCFEVRAPTKVIVDASPSGILAMLIQTQNDNNMKVIAYASRSLTETETRYSHIERECLAIYFGCVRFQMYLLGMSFTVSSDHKPLVYIFNNLRKSAPLVQTVIK